MSQAKAKYDTIGKTYNQTRTADPYLLERLYKHLNPHADGSYLDIGCGSGNYTNQLYKKGVNIMGIDPSIEMLKKARQKNSQIDYRIGVAEDIDLPNHSIAGATAFLTIHHWQDLKEGFAEIGRVLTIGARFVIFHSTPQQMEGYWLNHYFPVMMKNSSLLMPTLEKIAEAMTNAGLNIVNTENYFIKNDLQDLFLLCGKNEPELYLKPEIRSGISSFAAVANANEVEVGLKQLRADIDGGAIDRIISSYNSDQGDYLFIIAEKTS